MINNTLTYVWRRTPPATKLDPSLSNHDLFQHYLYFDYLNETRHHDDWGLKGFWYHFHTYRVSSVGLESGAMGYKVARDLLYETLVYNKPDRIIDIYLFWIDTLKKISPTSLEAWSDVKVVVRRVFEAISRIKEPELRAYYMGSLVETAKDELTTQEADRLISKGAKEILRKMPLPIDFARVYSRQNINHWPGKTDKKKVHGNSLRWIVSFANAAKRTGRLAHVQNLTNYLREVLVVYDPTLGDTYTTDLLLSFARVDEVVPASLAEAFRQRVVSALGSLNPGIHDKDNLLGDLVREYARLGRLDEAYRFLKMITEETTFMHAAGALMQYETEPDRIEREFLTTYLPLVALSWGENLAKLLAKEAEISGHERHMWLLQWLLAGEHLAEEGDFSRLNRADVLRYIYQGSADFHLRSLAEVCTNSGDSRWVRAAVSDRIARIIQKATGPQLEDSDDKTEHVKEAIESIFNLRRNQ